MKPSLRVLAPAVFLLGCGTTVVEQDAAAASGAGGGPTSSSASSSASAGGQGGAGGSLVASSSSSGTGGAIPACPGVYVDVVGFGTTQHFEGSCPNDWGANESSAPVAFFVMSGGGFIAQLHVFGCLKSTLPAPAIRVFAFGADSEAPGQYSGSVEYTDENGSEWYATAMAADITITQITEVIGEAVEGSYSGSVFKGGDIEMLSGTFRACKVSDLYPP